MKEIKVSTGNINSLINDLIKKIKNNEIRTWGYDDDFDFYHVSEQYENYYITYSSDDKRGVIVFTFLNYSGTEKSKFAEMKLPQLFSNMLNTHFGDRVVIL